VILKCLHKLCFFALGLLILFATCTILGIGTEGHLPIAEAQVQNPFLSPAAPQPQLVDPNLRVKLVYTGPGFPTNMAFIGPDDILLLSKNDGKVLRIKDGKNLGPVLEVNVTGKDEMGLLGIATEPYKNQKYPTKVFLYYSLCKSKVECNNFVYKYDWSPKQDKLKNPRLLLQLPGLPGPSHVGGDIAVGPDGYLYLTIGDLLSTELFNKNTKYNTKAQNYVEGVEPDGRGGILRITQEGKPVDKGIIGSVHTLNLYYAYGIKNSFGIGFDPKTGNLWDTENGPSFGDEINLVEPGFNGGWSKIQGFWTVSETGEKMKMVTGEPSGLVDFGGKGKYHEPKLVWDKTVAPTALTFLNSTKLGSQYVNDLFIGSVEDGMIFHFKLNDNRTELVLPDSLKSKIVSENRGEDEIMFGKGFGIVTDLQVGPHDGYLYVVSGDRPNRLGAVYKIIPK
jgi:aldose sugar dehydrogenase